MCFNKKVIGSLLALGVAVFVLAPSVFSAALPLLLVAACPLSMMLMMKSMKGMEGTAGDQSGSGPASDHDTKRTTVVDGANTMSEDARRSIAVQAEIDQLKAEKATLEEQLSRGQAVPRRSS